MEKQKKAKESELVGKWVVMHIDLKKKNNNNNNECISKKSCDRSLQTQKVEPNKN